MSSLNATKPAPPAGATAQNRAQACALPAMRRSRRSAPGAPDLYHPDGGNSPLPQCQGRGQIIEKVCHTCSGRGLERKKINKKVSIPAGVDNGMQIRLPGEGQPGSNGGPNGNLFMVVDVKPHEYFKRKGEDIILDLDINIAQAVLGADIPVPTVDGKEKLTIPAGTQPGKVFNMRGKGVPRIRQSGRGDQRVIVNVDIPNKLSAEQRELFEKLAEPSAHAQAPAKRLFRLVERGLWRVKTRPTGLWWAIKRN